MAKTNENPAREGRKRPPSVKPANRKLRAGTNCKNLKVRRGLVSLAADYIQCQNPEFFAVEENLRGMILGLAAFLPADHGIIHLDRIDTNHPSVQDTGENRATLQRILQCDILGCSKDAKPQTVTVGQEQLTFSTYVKCAYDNWLGEKAAEAAETGDKRISDRECFGFNRMVPRNGNDMRELLWDGGKDHNKEAANGNPVLLVALILMYIVYPGKLGEIDSFLTRLSMRSPNWWDCHWRWGGTISARTATVIRTG